ncbi:hypothetical protein FRB95_005733 [Tulasnella sp. JGI-2019a]|nr:hypothetical protein FRB95_005733 [Tulasnella sp. JGI-2019a]
MGYEFHPAAAVKRSALGGEIHIEKHEIPGGNMGHLAFFLDTEKNVMGIWSMN